jgi:hypothetical protein
MKKLIPGFALALALLAAVSVRPSEARITANIDVRIGQPAPYVVLDREPDMALVPGTRVYYDGDEPYDVYRSDSRWYVCDEGDWYRADSERGPFVSIAFSAVPRSIASCGPRGRGYAHSWYAPRGGVHGWFRRNVDWQRNDWSRGRHRGHDRGHDRDRDN